MRRALQSPYMVGHSFIWHLKAEVVTTRHAERYAVIMEEYLYHAGAHVFEVSVDCMHWCRQGNGNRSSLLQTRGTVH